MCAGIVDDMLADHLPFDDQKRGSVVQLLALLPGESPEQAQSDKITS